MRASMNQNFSGTRSSDGSRRPRLLIAAATIACCMGLTIENGAEQVDSGWAYATRSPVAPPVKHPDPRQQLILHDLLNNTQIPLLRETPNTHATPAAPSNARSQPAPPGSLRFAVRPDGIDGWRPAAPSTAPAADSSQGGTSANTLPMTTAPSSDDQQAPAATTPGPALVPIADDDAYVAIDDVAADQEEVDDELGELVADPDALADAEDNETENDPYGDADVGDEETPLGDDQSQDEADSLADSKPQLRWSAPPRNDVAAQDTTANDTSENEFGEALNEAKSDAAIRGGVDQGDLAKTAEPPKQPAEPPRIKLDESPSSSSTASDVGPINDRNAPVDSVDEPSPPPPLTKQLTALRSRVRAVLKGYYRRQLNSRENDPWEVMHGMLAYGVHSRVRQGGPRGAPVTSVGWLCYNKPCKDLTLLYVNPEGELRAKYGVGVQGHLGQFLAMLAQCRVSDEYPIRVGKREFTIRDLVEAEKKTCYPKSELTFKLLAFQYYLDLDDRWVNDQGVDWDFPRLIREELAQPIRGAACGGTHRLSSLSLTIKARRRRGEPIDGEYKRAHDFVQKYHRYAFGLQNKDGSLSTEWFRGRGDDSDIDRRIKTTGHILEWLCYSLSDEELRSPRTIAAVSYLANLMYSNYNHDWEVGPLSHATHALLLYDERVFQPFDSLDYTTTYKPKPRSGTSSSKRVQSQRMSR